jgi:hypothetical protein
MKYGLILENWKKFLYEVDVSPTTSTNPVSPIMTPSTNKTNVKTYGDLQKLIGVIQKNKKLSKTGEASLDLALDQVAGLIPGASNIKSAFDFFKIIYSADDTKKTNTWLDKINIDDDYAKIADDSVENTFLQNLLLVLSKKNPEELLPKDYNINKELQVFLKNKYNNRTLQGAAIQEAKKKKSGDRCTRIAKRKYDVWPSAYASGAVVKCRQGKIWKGISENMTDEEIDEALLLEEIEVIEEAKKKDYKPNFSKEKEQGLHGWFARNKGKGWVNCRTGGPCGRESADSGGKYPACRPTKAQCKSAGKGPLRKKKSSKPISWTKKKKKD